VGGVADLSQGLASLGNIALVGSKTVSEGIEDLGANLGVVTGGTQDLADDLDNGDVLGDLLVLGGLTGDEHLALLGLNLELLESLLQLGQLGGQVGDAVTSLEVLVVTLSVSLSTIGGVPVVGSSGEAKVTSVSEDHGGDKETNGDEGEHSPVVGDNRRQGGVGAEQKTGLASVSNIDWAGLGGAGAEQSYGSVLQHGVVCV